MRRRATPIRDRCADSLAATSMRIRLFPTSREELEARCAEIFAIQIAGLVKRLVAACRDRRRLRSEFPVAWTARWHCWLRSARAMRSVARRKDIRGITMPGFGTTEHTKASADQLIEATGITGECIDIRQLCLDTFRSIGHHRWAFRSTTTRRPSQLQEALLGVSRDAVGFDLRERPGTDSNDVVDEPRVCAWGLAT